jgi:hypothetical protein
VFNKDRHKTKSLFYKQKNQGAQSALLQFQGTAKGFLVYTSHKNTLYKLLSVFDNLEGNLTNPFV